MPFTMYRRELKVLKHCLLGGETIYQFALVACDLVEWGELIRLLWRLMII
jgi:hypothetical protein